MRIFGPHYPSPLQHVINHAERCALLLANVEVAAHPTTEGARVWLTGRADEIEAVIGCFVTDWRDGNLSEGAVVAAVSSYLRALHIGARRYLALGPQPECCQGEVTITVPLTPYVHDGRTQSLPTSTTASGDTLAGPLSVLADNPSHGKPGR